MSTTTKATKTKTHAPKKACCGYFDYFEHDKLTALEDTDLLSIATELLEIAENPHVGGRDNLTIQDWPNVLKRHRMLNDTSVELFVNALLRVRELAQQVELLQDRIWGLRTVANMALPDEATPPRLVTDGYSEKDEGMESLGQKIERLEDELDKLLPLVRARMAKHD